MFMVIGILGCKGNARFVFPLVLQKEIWKINSLVLAVHFAWVNESVVDNGAQFQPILLFYNQPLD